MMQKSFLPNEILLLNRVTQTFAKLHIAKYITVGYIFCIVTSLMHIYDAEPNTIKRLTLRTVT